jgi:hypothetical protein
MNHIYLFIYLILFVCLFVCLFNVTRQIRGWIKPSWMQLSKYIQVLYSHSIPIPPFPELDEGTLFQDPTWYKQWFSASRFPSTSPWKMYSHQISIQLCVPSSFQFLEKPDWECCMYIYIYDIYGHGIYIDIRTCIYRCVCATNPSYVRHASDKPTYPL